MNLSDFIQLVLGFTERWLGTTFPRIIIAFLGVLLCVLIVIAIWDRRVKMLGGALGLISGLLMVGIALDPRILHFLAATSFMTRIRILMGILSFIVLVITIEAIRRAHLQERYALLWVTTGLIILIAAFFPNMLDLFRILIGTQYVTAVVGIVFTFLLLIAFHFSIALSGFQKNQTKIAQRFAILEERIAELTRQLNAAEPGIQKLQSQQAIMLESTIQDETPHFSANRSLLSRFNGNQIGVCLIISLAFISVLSVGLLTPQAMVGDEVTHFFMLTNQSENLSNPNFYAEIPTGWGATEVRRYPHSFLWHYLGAIVYRITSGSFLAVQIFQSIFFAQFLFVAYLLAKSRHGNETRSVLLYLLVLASLPVCLIFSVTFYQDIPMTAQVLTAFFLLRKRHWLAGSLFMCLAIGFKETAMLFLPAFFVLMMIWEFKMSGWLRSTLALACSGLIILGFIYFMGHSIKMYAEAGFYPQEKLEKIVRSARNVFSSKDRYQARVDIEEQNSPQGLKQVTPYEVQIIAKTVAASWHI